MQPSNTLRPVAAASDYPGAARVFEATLSLSITTAVIGGGLVLLAANVIARYAFHMEAGDHALAAAAIRAGAVLLALRWIESAYTSTLKGLRALRHLGMDLYRHKDSRNH